ncbi:hypothetical protein OUZ56_030708 [Daphnia magna]|uniref:Uncharacterized protein n=1 Tax=Daphnia magna TaxID=35525 RepID=A0ABQ9ZS43_9CRUS|nr:hypothetical protein OUZ56_030708 [Daphnia magna]
MMRRWAPARKYRLDIGLFASRNQHFSRKFSNNSAILTWMHNKAEDFVYVSFAILVECDITQIKLRL